MANTEFQRIRQECVRSGALYEDPDFPAVTQSLFYHQPPNNVTFEWKRPKDLCAKPQFIIDDEKKFDVVLGRYGHPWFVSSLAILYQYRGLFYRAVPADQGFTKEFQYSGVFHFRLWWGGEWVEVSVDDRLPTINGQLAFVQSQSSNQFWAALLEKAYAKYKWLHNSYEALAYTTVSEVMSELSGGTMHQLPVHQPSTSELQSALFPLLQTTVLATAVAATDKDLRNGIVPGRNYCLLGLNEVTTEFGSTTLVRLRLSPGLPPFTGPWANPMSPEWSDVSLRQKSDLNINAEAVNNAFWMSWADFCATFTRLDCLHMDGDTCRSEKKLLTLKAYQTRSYQSSWFKGSTAGGCRNQTDTFHINPQLLLRVNDSSQVLIVLLQQQTHEPKVIGFSVYKAPTDQGSEERLAQTFFRSNKACKHSTYSNTRQVVLKMYLDAGHYVIVPTTYDAGMEGSFILRVYSLTGITLGALDCQPGDHKSPVLNAPTDTNEYREMFTSFADERKTINAFELQELLHSCLPNDYMKSSASLDVCRRVIQAFQSSESVGRIGYEQFRDFVYSLKVWQKIFEFYSQTTSGVIKAEKLREALDDVGFRLSSDTLQLSMLRYMRRDGTLRFGDFVACILHLIAAFNTFSRKDMSKTGLIKLNNSEWMKAVLRC